MIECDISCIEMLIVTVKHLLSVLIVVFCILDNVVISQKDPNQRHSKIGSKFATEVNWKDPKLTQSFEQEFSQLIARYSVTMYIQTETKIFIYIKQIDLHWSLPSTKCMCMIQHQLHLKGISSITLILLMTGTPP